MITVNHKPKNTLTERQIRPMGENIFQTSDIKTDGQADGMITVSPLYEGDPNCKVKLDVITNEKLYIALL